MKKFLLILSTILFIISCDKDDNSNPTENVDFETKDVNVTITLPENSNIDISNLTVSSLFTLDNNNTDGQSSVELFNENAIEMVYATNSEGNMIMLNLINPGNTDEVVLNSKTTAQSLAMLHPWVMNLSIEARQEAYQEIALMPEFENYHNLIIQGINSGELDPLANNSITQAIGNFQNTILQRVEIETLPLLMVAENNNVKVTNKKSSLAYSLQLYDENSQAIGDEYLVDGVNKEILSWSIVSNALNGNFDLFQPQEVDFPIPSTNQGYKLKADAWNGKAAWTNGAKVASNLIGIVSTTLAEVGKLAGCANEIGNFIVNNTSNSITALNSNQISTSVYMDSLINFVGDNSSSIYGLVNDCSSQYSFGSEAFQKTIKKLSYVGNLDNAALLFFNAVDIAQYDSEIQFCFEKIQDDIIECDALELSGAWNTEYLTNPPCTGNSSSFNSAFNNRELNFISINETSGTIERDFYIGGIYNEVLNISTYEYDPINQTLNITMESSGLRFGTDTLERNFYFNGTLNESTQEFEGDFNSSLELFVDNSSIGIPNTTSIKNCNGTMKIKR